MSRIADLLFSPFGLVGLYVALYLLPLGFRPLGIPDEMRYAEIPREMLASGDWISPHLDGLRYFEKPPLGYWLNAISIHLFGETPFAVRLPSAIAAGLTGCLLWGFTRRVTGDARAAGATTLVYLTAFGVYLIGTFAVLDTLFTFGLSCTLVLFYLAAESPPGRRRIAVFVACGVAAGLSFLTKGFLAIAIPGLVLLPWLIWCRYWRLLKTEVWLVAIVTLAVIAPWGILVHLREPDFWRYFVFEEHLKRFAADDAQHKAPIYYFLVALPLLLLPWTALVPAAWSARKRIEGWPVVDPSGFRLLLCWSLLPFLFFSVSKGKLATYILPCIGPVSILLAVGLLRIRKLPRQPLVTRGIVAIAAVLGIASLAFVLIQFAGLGKPVYGPEETMRALVFTALLCCCLLAVWLSLRSRDGEARLAWLALSILPFAIAYSAALPDQVIDRKGPTRFLQQFPTGADPDTIVISDSSLVHSVAWEFRRDDVYLLSAGELDYGLGRQESGDRLLDPARLARLIAYVEPGQQLLVFYRKRSPEWVDSLVPTDAVRITQGSFTGVRIGGSAK